MAGQVCGMGKFQIRRGWCAPIDLERKYYGENRCIMHQINTEHSITRLTKSYVICVLFFIFFT